MYKTCHAWSLIHISNIFLAGCKQVWSATKELKADWKLRNISDEGEKDGFLRILSLYTRPYFAKVNQLARQKTDIGFPSMHPNWTLQIHKWLIRFAISFHFACSPAQVFCLLSFPFSLVCTYIWRIFCNA